ncbi:hypothetical protein [Lysinibacillus sphaericus]|nr:hypothetical protein [Lysinibacillus sphaericus]
MKARKDIYNGSAYNFFNMNSDKICFMFCGTGYNQTLTTLRYFFDA